MGTNSVSNNGKKIVQKNPEIKKSQTSESYILRQTDEELQLGLNGNKKFWENTGYKSKSSLFESDKTTATKSSNEIFGLEKTASHKTAAKPSTKTKTSNEDAKTKAHIAEIIKDDEARGKSKNTPEQVSDLIVKTAKKYDVDPLMIASIAKQETHFTQEKSGKNGKGMMQLTTISLKDMYQRSKVYGKELKPLLDKYGSHEKLLKAVKDNVAVNIEVGTALFKAKLKNAKGNVTKALQNYNGSSLKVSYAKSVQEHYKEIKK